MRKVFRSSLPGRKEESRAAVQRLLQFRARAAAKVELASFPASPEAAAGGKRQEGARLPEVYPQL